MTIDEWIARFEKAGITVDDEVIELKSGEASTINNAGLGEQLSYLLGECGEDYLSELLGEEDAPDDASPNVALTIRKSEAIDDWYVIERKVHDGRVWTEYDRNGDGTLMVSARFSDADVEGTSAEMLAIAEAIFASEATAFRRCAVDARTPQVKFYSPRNSQRPGVVSDTDALALAREIQLLLGKDLPR